MADSGNSAPQGYAWGKPNAQDVIVRIMDRIAEAVASEKPVPPRLVTLFYEYMRYWIVRDSDFKKDWGNLHVDESGDVGEATRNREVGLLSELANKVGLTWPKGQEWDDSPEIVLDAAEVSNGSKPSM